MRYIVLVLALCFAISAVDAKPRPTAHKVKVRKSKVKGRKAVKRPTVQHNKAN